MTMEQKAAIEAVKAFNDALEALEAAHAWLSEEPNSDDAFDEWGRAVEQVKALHQPIVDRAMARVKK